MYERVNVLDKPKTDRRPRAGLARHGIMVYYGWRHNLPDEGDNHLVELALAGSAHAVVTHNLQDFIRGELRWRGLLLLSPADCLERLK